MDCTAPTGFGRVRIQMGIRPPGAAQIDLTEQLPALGSSSRPRSSAPSTSWPRRRAGSRSSDRAGWWAKVRQSGLRLINENTRFDTNLGGAGLTTTICAPPMPCTATPALRVLVHGGTVPDQDGPLLGVPVTAGPSRSWSVSDGDDQSHFPVEMASIDTEAFGAMLRELQANLEAQEAAEETHEEAELERALEYGSSAGPCRDPAERYLRDCRVKVSEEAEEVLGLPRLTVAGRARSGACGRIRSSSVPTVRSGFRSRR